MIFPDGKKRIVRLGVPDTYFTIPAQSSHGRIGFVTLESDGYYFHGGYDAIL